MNNHEKSMELKTACQMTTSPFERMKVLAEVVLQAPEEERPDLLREILRAVGQLRRPHIEMDVYAFYRTDHQETAAREQALAAEYCLALRALGGEKVEESLFETVPWLVNLCRVSMLLSGEERTRVLAKNEALRLECGLEP